MIVGTLRPPRLPVALVGRQRVPSTCKPSRAVMRIRSPEATRPCASAAPSTAGRESVTWRGRAPSGATPGTGSSQRSCGRVSLSPMAATHAPSASQPIARQTPSHGSIRTPAVTVGGRFGGRPRPRLSGAPPATLRTTRSMSPSCTSIWANRDPSGEGSGAYPMPPDGSPCSRSPSVRTTRSAPSAERRTTWNQPSASDTYSKCPVGQPGRARVVASLARDDRLGPAGEVDDRDLVGLEIVRLALARDREPRTIRRPGDAVDVHARLGDRHRDGRARILRGPTPPRDRRIDQPDARPAATTGDEGQSMAVRRPSRLAPAAGLRHDPGQAGSVGFDHPDLVVADEGEPAAIRRPLRIADRLLGRGELDRGAAPQRQAEELSCPGRLGRVRDDAVARVDAELARRLDGGDRLDGQSGRA